MARTFTVAGTSIKDGTLTYRFASGTAKARAAVLERNEHTEVKMIDLPSAMTKDAAIAHLNGLGITAVLPKTGRKPAEDKAVEDGAKALLAAVEQTDQPAEVVAEDDVKFLTNMTAA
jgi:hypothetical protein